MSRDLKLVNLKPTGEYFVQVLRCAYAEFVYKMAAANFSWTKSLKDLPSITYDVIQSHLSKTGRSVVGEKGYKFFAESFIHEVFAAKLGENLHKLKAKCYRSQRKNEKPHELHIEILKNIDGNIKVGNGSCSCKAG